MALSRRALLTGAPALAGCGRSRTRRIQILAVSMPAFLQLPLVAAHELGFFREHGLSTSIEDVSSGVRAIESVLSGSADVISTLFDQLITMAVENRGLRSFLLMEAVSPTVL